MANWNSVVSLKGPKGDTGTAGEQGEQGPPGADGTSVQIVDNVPTAADLPTDLTEADAGKGWITDDDGHLHVWSGTAFTDAGNIKGPKGDTGTAGDDGRGIVSVEILNYDLLVTYSDSGTPVNLGNIRGQQGTAGTDGTDGLRGSQIFTGSEFPATGMEIGDIFIDADDGVLYQYTA